MPSASLLNVVVRIAIHSLSGVRLAEESRRSEAINFDVKARMEERERRSGLVSVGFALVVGTKPSVAKFEVEGAATLEGKDADIAKMLEIDPETQTPNVFQRVYQHVFMSMYLLATLIDAPHPPPNLLFSGQQQLPTAPTVREQAIAPPAPERNMASRGEAPTSDAEQPASTTAEVQERTLARSEVGELPAETNDRI